MMDRPVRETAQIIPFPTRGGRDTSPAREVVARKSAERLPVPVCEFGSGWYHDAAVQEERRTLPPR